MKLGIIILLPIFILLLPLLELTSSSVLASGRDAEPSVRTNINKRTDLFQKGTGNAAELEQNVDRVRNAAAEVAGQGAGQEYLGDSAKIEAEIDNLSSTGANELENRGRNELFRNNNSSDNSPDNFSSLYPDETKPLNIAHRQDAERIAEGSGKLLGNLLGHLKELGIDCRTIKGNKELEPEYFVDVKKVEIKDTVYNKKICEERRNKYECRDVLTLKCLDFKERPAEFQITGSSIPYRTRVHSDYTSYEFSSTGNFARAVVSGGRMAGGNIGNKALKAVGFGKNTGSLTTYEASVAGFSLSFNIRGKKETIRRLELVDIYYASFIMISVNGNLVYAGPVGGNQLVTAGYHEETHKGKRKYGGKVGKKVKHTKRYPIIDTGSGQHILGKGGVPNESQVDRIDLLPFAVEGYNVIELRGIGLGRAVINMTLNASERICRNWQEIWDEVCVLK